MIIIQSQLRSVILRLTFTIINLKIILVNNFFF